MCSQEADKSDRCYAWKIKILIYAYSFREFVDLEIYPQTLGSQNKDNLQGRNPVLLNFAFPLVYRIPARHRTGDK